jgi:outer membrane protein assembly factor BamB
LKAPITNGPTPNGFIVAFKLQEEGGKIMLTPGWISRDLDSPLPPVIANGVVFALSAGEFTRQVRTVDGVTTVDERPKGSTRATLYALDARTGKELYSSRNLVNGPASLTGLTVANGRVYFGGLDGTLYAFGMYVEH